jgi:Short C-terminal domain
LLVQAGVQGQQDTTSGETGVFILAAISFAIGLVINEAIERLIKFAKDTLGGDKRDEGKLATVEERLKRVKKLKDDGLITQEEYNERKKEILWNLTL